MRHSKKLAALAIATGVAITASAAFAFWSADGSGSGSGAVADGYGGANAVTLVGTVSSDLFPGGSSVVTFTAKNNDADEALAAGTIRLVSVAPDEDHAACDTSLFDGTTGVFSMGDVDASAESISPGATISLDAEGTLNMENKDVNQDNCKGATLTLTLSSLDQPHV
jgi:hypothetical protein